MSNPFNFEIEFEKLNNYYERQYQAWEFDQMLDKCNELDLRVEWNMLIHYALSHHDAGEDRWDWDNTQNCVPCGIDTESTHTNGYCYWNGCDDTEIPSHFLTSTCARNNYKKKLRYMIARWGYSKNIFLMELVSEMNNIGRSKITEANGGDVNNNGVLDENIEYPPLYDSDPENVRLAVANWHHEMAEYIKDHLHHTRHLIAADYAGTGPMNFADLNLDKNCTPEIEICNACQTNYYDQSWHSTYIDVIAFSNYNDGFNRWEKSSVHEYFNNAQSSGLLCGWNNPDDSEDNENWHSALNSFESIWKPVIHAEDGYTACMDLDFTGFIKDLVTAPFSGHATSGMSWDEYSNTDQWDYFNTIRSFLESFVLNSVDLGTGNWQPGHSYSEPNADNNQTINAEVVYLHNTDDENEMITGVILNRSWNNKTVCACGLIPSGDAYDNLDNFYECGYENDPIQIKENELGIHNYTIRYFDPYSLVMINEENRISALAVESGSFALTHKISLENYPLMYNGSNDHQPFYFFTIHREGEEFQGMPTFSDHTAHITMVTSCKSDSQTSTFQTDPHYKALDIYPNPASTDLSLIISSNFLNKKLVIMDVSGRIVHRQRLSDLINVINISHLSNGCYTIQIDVGKPEKVIIQK